jgi:hypothetical protein
MAQREPWLVLFCGVDIESSTKIKMRGGNNWYMAFIKFFQEFDSSLRDADSADGDGIKNGWNLWRVVGDELIYYRLIDRNNPRICRYVTSFKDAIIKNSSTEQGGVVGHGYAFIGDEKTVDNIDQNKDFQINIMPRAGNGFDKDYAGDPGDFISEKLNELKYTDIGVIDETSFMEFTKEYFIDFMGRTIDQGFRLSEFSNRYRFILSPKLVSLIFVEEDSSYIDIRFMGLQRLDGCTNDLFGISHFPVYYIYISELMNISNTSKISHKDYKSNSALDIDIESSLERQKSIIESVRLSSEKIRSSAEKFVSAELEAYKDLCMYTENSTSFVDGGNIEVSADDFEYQDKNDSES